MAIAVVILRLPRQPAPSETDHFDTTSTKAAQAPLIRWQRSSSGRLSRLGRCSDARQSLRLRERLVANGSASDRLCSPAIDVGAVRLDVDGCRTDRSMPQRLLHDGQRRAAVQKVMSDAMPQRVDTLAWLEFNSSLGRATMENFGAPLPTDSEDQRVRQLVLCHAVPQCERGWIHLLVAVLAALLRLHAQVSAPDGAAITQVPLAARLPLLGRLVPIFANRVRDLCAGQPGAGEVAPACR
jgi:hypothetical protein